MIRKLISFILVWLALCGTSWSSEIYLLSNNFPGKKSIPAGYSEWSQSLATDMKVEWVTQGECASDKEAQKTGSGRVLFDGNTGSNWKSIAYSKWSGGSWVTLNLSFEKEYLIQALDVWALHEKSRDTDYVEILFSQDGINYIPHQRTQMPDLPLGGKQNFVKIPLRLEKPVLAQYLQVRICRKKSARQQQISDIAVWGSEPENGKKYLTATDRPEVEFTVNKVQSGVAVIDWSAFKKLNPNVKSWTIYSSSHPYTSIQDESVELLKKVGGKEERTLLYPLTPGKTYHFAVSAVFNEGENPKVRSIECAMPEPLACDTFSDMVAINHFWGGGGNRQKDSDRNDEAYETVALDLLAQTGISHIRWWLTDRRIVEKYYNKGIGLYTYPYGNNMDKGLELGVHAFSGPGNEPDLKTKPIERYVNSLRIVYEKKEKLSPESVICAPSSGLEDSSIEWLDKMYELGAKPYFDVLDLHSYCKIAGGHIEPEGYPKGAPEAMFDNMRKIRQVLEKHGDWGKPMISTEFGYSDSPVNNPSGPMTPQMKADYLVRGLIIHHVLGFKRVFLYSFFDEGEDINFTEHTFGIIDYYLQKKPAFYAIQTLMRTLEDGVYEKPVSGITLPSYGYEFRHRDSSNRTVVLWDGTQNRIATFKTSAAEVTLTKLLGETLTLIPDQEGYVTAPFGSSPVYLTAPSGLQFVSSEVAQASDNQSDWSVRPTVKKVIAGPNQKTISLPFTLEGQIEGEQTVRVIVTESKAGVIIDRILTVKGKEQDLKLDIDLAKLTASLQKLKVQVVQKTNGLAVSKEYSFFLRRLQEITNSQQAQLVSFPGLESPVHVLGNDQITATIDSARGGRVLEIIDHKTLTNQLRLDYNVLPNLPSLPFAYGIWTKLNGQLKDAPMKVLQASTQMLILQGQVGDLEITQSWRVNNSALEHHVRVANKGTSAKNFSLEVHPEYQVGGNGESVTDVFYFPLGQRVERLPFWSGLGEKQCGELTQNWWAVLDTVADLSMTQTLEPKDWANPRIWFGQGNYNVELKTRPGLQLEAQASWETRLSWILEHGKTETDFINTNSAH
ncbi:hypothetical protein [Coraliomargarita parva]|uniref:hypothetical protein n=1 Tax=Coraliomargarita parva TaxID=3014050 RepID=UPI0022B522FC|nr:hypothetical protein [Coraliomargarita parva]